MTPRDCFGVVVRTVGLLTLLFGFYDLLCSVYILLTPGRHHNAAFPVYSVYGLIFIVVSLFLLRGAPRLVQFCYPDGALREQSRGDE